MNDENQEKLNPDQKSNTNPKSILRKPISFNLAAMIIFMLLIITTTGIIVLNFGKSIKTKQTIPTLSQQNTPTTYPFPSTVPIDTTNWKTYKDDYAEFKYPPHYQLLKEIPKEFVFEEDKAPNGWKGNHMFMVFDTSSYYENNAVLQNTQQPSTIIVTNAQIGSLGNEDRKRIILINNTSKEISIYKWQGSTIRRNGESVPWQGDIIEKAYFHSQFDNIKSYDFNLAFKEGKDPTAELIFDQVLSSFKYLKSYTPITSITSWKIFKSDKYGFSFEYPAEWGDAQEGKTRDVAIPNSGRPLTPALDLNFSERSNVYLDSFYLTGDNNNCSGQAAQASATTEDNFNLSQCDPAIFADEELRSWTRGGENNAWIYFSIPKKEYCSFTLSLPISSGDKKVSLGENNCTSKPSNVDTKLQIGKIQKILGSKDLDAETRANLQIYKHILETAKIY